MKSATDSHVADLRPGLLRRYPGPGDGRIGVAGYALRRDAILVEFMDGAIYLYNHEVPGRRHVQRMQALATAGAGLSAYISRHVGKRFAARLR